MAGPSRIRIEDLLNPISSNTEEAARKAESSLGAAQRTYWFSSVAEDVTEKVGDLTNNADKSHNNRFNAYIVQGLTMRETQNPPAAWTAGEAISESNSLRSDQFPTVGPSQDPNSTPHELSGPSQAPFLLNEARALRIVELMNDYRTLLFHILEHTTSIPLENIQHVGPRTLIESREAAQMILSRSYVPATVPGCDTGPNKQEHQISEVILDASSRRHQAYKIYLRVSAAKRWIMNRAYLEYSLSNDEFVKRQQERDAILYKELEDVTDEFVASDLRQADVRSGYWVDEDPPLPLVTRLDRPGPLQGTSRDSKSNTS